jgi:hypothetical protein
MVLGGLLRVVATMVLAFPEYLEKKRGVPLGGGRKRTGTHIVLISISALISMMGTFFGPVSIAVPVLTGSQLMFNVVAMGVILRMRTFDKAQRVGTYVVFLSVLSLIDVGPGVQDGQDLMSLLESTRAKLWSFVIGLSMVVSTICTLPLTREDTGSQFSVYHKHAILTLTIGSAMSNVAMATLGKALSLLTGDKLYLAGVLYIVTGLLGTLFSVVSSTICEQGVFTPLSAVALIVANAVTGIIVWEDWKVINTWLAYICAILLMCCGVYLLADVDILENILRKKKVASSGLRPFLQAPDLITAEQELTPAQSAKEAWSVAVETTYLIP